MSGETAEGKNLEESVSAELQQRTVELLIPLDQYLASGVHIGTHICTKHMREFVYRVRPDGLYVLDVRKIDERIRIAARFISRYEPQKVVATATRQYGQQPVEKYCSLTGCKPITGRIIPGIFTNPRLEWYLEPELVIVTDPRADSQALQEAAEMGIPVVAFVDTDNKTEFVDMIIPANNKGRKSIAFLYWLLARQVLRERGELSPTAELPVSVEEFIAKGR